MYTSVVNILYCVNIIALQDAWALTYNTAMTHQLVLLYIDILYVMLLFIVLLYYHIG